MKYVLDGLELIAEPRAASRDRADWDAWYKDLKARGLDYFKTDAAIYFFWYRADNQEITEQ